MPRYDRSDIRAGIFLTLDGGPCIEAPRPPAPRPVRYGDSPPPDFGAASTNLDQIRQRIEKLRADLRAARERK